jgi:hypothetical protein
VRNGRAHRAKAHGRYVSPRRSVRAGNSPPLARRAGVPRLAFVTNVFREPFCVAPHHPWRTSVAGAPPSSAASLLVAPCLRHKRARLPHEVLGSGPCAPVGSRPRGPARTSDDRESLRASSHLASGDDPASADTATVLPSLMLRHGRLHSYKGTQDGRIVSPGEGE